MLKQGETKKNVTLEDAKKKVYNMINQEHSEINNSNIVEESKIFAYEQIPF
jgi:hypothetical protein